MKTIEKTPNIISTYNDDMTVTVEMMSTIEAIFRNNNTINSDKENPIYYESLSHGSSSLNSESLGVINDIIFSPIISAVHNSDIITIGILLIAKTDKALLEQEDLSFYYQFAINDLGLPQLNIYVSFKQVASGDDAKYWDNTFQITVSQNINSNIYLKEISTVQVFLVDEDPRTTRGTVTTVRRPM